MKRTIRILGLSAAGLLALGGVVSAAPTPPAQCSGVYSNVIQVSGNAGSVKGTNGNDFIYVTGDRNSIRAGAGDDCIQLTSTAEANSVKAEGGNDTVVSEGTRNSVNGGSGTDRCEINPATESDRGCEL